jgi:hypothetical protein
MGAIEHDRGETRFDAGFRGVIIAMVQVKNDRDGDAQRTIHGFDHRDHDRIAAHVFGRPHRDAQNDRSLQLLGL